MSVKLMSRSSPNPRFWFPSRASFASLFFSTKTQARTKTKTSTLYGWIEKVGDPKASIVPILDQWVSEVHGSAQAEQYFHKLSDKQKNFKVYGALLRSYARENSVYKAEAVLQEMKEKGMANSSFPYNIMINLYTQIGAFEKIDMLIQEMERNQIPRHVCTLKNLVAAYGAASNISAMEGILNQVENDPQLAAKWIVYRMAASGYLKVGSTGKALTMLKKAEKNMPIGKKTWAFNFLLNLYAETGKKDELYRIWNTYKPKVQVNERDICCMITCLSKAGCIEGAEKIFEEWESQCITYDFRVLNRLLVAYCKKGLLEKAEAALEKAGEGRWPNASSRNIMLTGYLKHNQMSKAVEMLKRDISFLRKGWRPNRAFLDACLDYLEEQGDVNQMEEIIKSLKSLQPLSKDYYHRLVRTYRAAQRPVGELHDPINVDGNAAAEQTCKIFETN